MKKLLTLIFLFSIVLSVSAQSRLGYLTRNYSYYNYNYKKGESVYYKPAGKGKVRIWGASEWGKAIPESYVKFSGYYAGTITDPVDDYVNVRSGPGTNYSIVTTVDVCEPWLYKKTNTNWVKLYYQDGTCIGYIYGNRINSSCPIP